MNRWCLWASVSFLLNTGAKILVPGDFWVRWLTGGRKQWRLHTVNTYSAGDKDYNTIRKPIKSPAWKQERKPPPCRPACLIKLPRAWHGGTGLHSEGRGRQISVSFKPAWPLQWTADQPGNMERPCLQQKQQCPLSRRKQRLQGKWCFSHTPTQPSAELEESKVGCKV